MTQQDPNTSVGERPGHACSTAACAVREPCAASAQPDGVKLALVNGIAGRLMQLSVDAVHGFDAVLERFELGQRKYGELDIIADRRDWRAEAIEELLDMAVYRGLGIVGARRRGEPVVAITFDVSDVDEEPTRPRARTITIPPLLPQPQSTFDVVEGVVSELLK